MIEKQKNETETKGTEKMKNQTFGIEIETIYSTPYTPGQPPINGYKRAAIAIKGVVGGRIAGRNYSHAVSRETVVDSKDRTWEICSDGSCHGGTPVEIVSPPLQYGDIEEVQEVVRAIKTAGFKVNSSCGIHVHVGTKTIEGDEITGKALKILAKTMKAKEAIIKKATKRIGSRWCRDLESDLISRIASADNNLRSVGRAWYGVENYNHSHYARNHYHGSRYHALNLHSVFFRGTVEFRMFESTLHAGKVKAYIQFCLALTHKARTAKSASSRTSRSHNNDKYTLRVFMNHLGLKGDEFKTCRTHLLKNLEGSASYRTRDQQDAGHERARATQAA